MDTLTIILFAGVAFAIQIAIFIMARRHKKKAMENDLFIKYRIKSRQDAWRLMQNSELPDHERAEIKRLYEEMTADK